VPAEDSEAPPAEMPFGVPSEAAGEPADAEPDNAPAPSERPANEPVPTPNPGAEDAPVPQPAPDAEATTPTEDGEQSAEQAPDAMDQQPDDAEPAPADAAADAPDSAADAPFGIQPDASADSGETSDRPVESPEPVPAETQNEAVAPDDVSASDARVQRLEEPVAVPSVTAEQGERFERPRRDRGDGERGGRRGDREARGEEDRRDGAPELPPGVEIVDRVGDRDILSIVGAGIAGAVAGGAAGYFIRGDDEGRLVQNADEEYYERLPRGRTRQTVVRPNGVQVVTISNRYGDIIQRSRIMPDGREIVLFYDPYAARSERPTYDLDPARDLPPLRVEIPRDEYIVDVSEPDEDLYYRTIVAPPVETVERIYSVDEVRRSERIRDKVRRIDLNTINFGFGSATIEQDQVDNLQALADAINEVIDKNPAETFLIEGHTDAVGSDLANLALSDERAEAVAAALTEYFDVPPENLVTQGYGEAYLKVDTQEQNAENRRVTVRRITPLVKPVQTSSAN